MRIIFAVLNLPLGYKLLGVVLAFGGALGIAYARARYLFTPGVASNAHHVIESACSQCHTHAGALDNRGCLACHQRSPDETHPPALFDDPRWAARLEVVDATRCAACHIEHAGFQATQMQSGLCFGCHDDVTQRKLSHSRFTSTSCHDAGCHNYHDNTALSRAYVQKHLDEPDLLPSARVPARERHFAAPVVPVVPAGLAADRAIVLSWSTSAHAGQDVGCPRCHSTPDGRAVSRPDETSCADCHEAAAQGFAHGKHGARAAVGLGPLAPRMARLAMKKTSGGASLGCGACHDVHSVETRSASVRACLGCHDDEHSRSYVGSPHERLVRTESDETAIVTCATCHQPRRRVESAGKRRIAVEHDVSLMIRERDKMLAAVCVGCHGLPFAMASIYDEKLVRSNFSGKPASVHPTVALIGAVSREAK